MTDSLTYATIGLAVALSASFELAPAITIASIRVVPALSYESVAWGEADIMFADAETPEGEVDGFNAIFTLKNAPSPAASLMLFLGLIQQQGIDYALDGNVITFGEPPDAEGEPPIAWYRY